MPRLPIPGTPVNRLDHQRLMALVNSMSDGVLALDNDGRVMMSNSVALNILDLNDASGKKVDEIMRLQDKNQKPVELGKMIAEKDGAFFSRNWQLRYSDNTVMYLFISVAPVRLGFGTDGQGGYVILLRDITREKSLEEERDEFISVASHELRTPVAIAEGSVSNALLLAEREGLGPEVKKILTSAHDQIIFLGNMLNDLSTLSRAEQGKLAMLVEEFNVDDLLQSLIHDYRPQALQKNLSLDYSGQTTLGELSSSRLYVREVLQNFLTNAIKYTEKGGVTLSAQAKDGGIEFSVADTGLGIGRNEQAKLFEKFFRSDDWRIKKINGTGLGLYVALKLAKLIEGKLTFESELNRGSTFRLWVPSIKPPARNNPAASQGVAKAASLS